MATTVGPRPTWDLLRDSGEQRPRASRRTDMIMTVVSMWFVLGLLLDAYAHANLPELETFLTPWHAVFYSGFVATGGWVLWAVWRNAAQGRRGRAAVPEGYGMTVVALPVFAVSGAVDLLWHTLLGIETAIDIFFSPSHLGLIAAMIVILTTPLRSAWSDPGLEARPSLRAVFPAVLTLSFAAGLVLLFLNYGNALFFDPEAIVGIFSTVEDGDASMLAARIVVTHLVLLAPLLVLARRWHLPPGAATISYATAALITATLLGFERLEIPLAIVAAGIGVDLLARLLRPAADRRAAYWAFAGTAPVLTWTLYLGVASAVAGRLPAVTELWTGVLIVTGLLGWLLAALMLPDPRTATSERGLPVGG